MVSEQLHYTTNREEIFIFSNKKCRIYAACGVSQTPNQIKMMEGAVKNRSFFKMQRKGQRRKGGGCYGCEAGLL